MDVCVGAQTAWAATPIDPVQWLPGYVTARYGPSTPSGVLDAWNLLLTNVYSTMQQWQVGACCRCVPSEAFGRVA